VIENTLVNSKHKKRGDHAGDFASWWRGANLTARHINREEVKAVLVIPEI